MTVKKGPTPPICPECGKQLQSCTNYHTGQAFWGHGPKPKCSYTQALDGEFFREGLKQEAHNLSGYHRHEIAPTVKRKVKRYSDDEKHAILEIFFECVGDLDKVLEAVAERREADKECVIRKMTKSKLYGFVNNHIQDIYEMARTARGLPAVLQLTKQADQDSIRFAAARELLNRADGMPTQTSIETKITLSWSDIEASRAKALKQYGGSEDGEWIDPEPEDES